MWLLRYRDGLSTCDLSRTMFLERSVDVDTRGLALLASLCRLAVVRKCFRARRGRAIMFSIFFHSGPGGNKCSIVTKLSRIVSCVGGLGFSCRSISCLEKLKLFDRSFLRCLDKFRFDKSVCTVPRKDIVFPERPLLGIMTPVVRTRLIRATVLAVLGRRYLVTAGTSHIICTTRKSNVVRFKLHHTRKPSTKLCKTETTIVNKYIKASGMLTNRVFSMPIVKARTRD